MPTTLELESTLTDRYQTTIPETVRRALLTRASAAESNDPVLDQFLHFLANDMANQPQRLQLLDTHLQASLHALVGDIEVDLHAALAPDKPQQTAGGHHQAGV